MFKWEKYAKSTHSQKDLRLTFKKRLFVGPQRIPEQQVEFDLIFYQVQLRWMYLIYITHTHTLSLSHTHTHTHSLSLSDSVVSLQGAG